MATRALRILVADDEEGVRESLRLILAPEYALTIVSNGKDAFEQLSRHAFDLALLDIKMPKMDGLEILRRLKRARRLVPILMLTAYQSVELAKEAVKLGALDYFPKPLDRERVCRVVQGVLNGSPRKR